MEKRAMEQESKEQAHADRRKFIRHNVLMTDLKTLATQFIARFDLQSKSAAYDALLASLNQEGFTEQAAEVKTKEFKTWLTTALAEDRSALQTVVNRQQTKLEVAGVLKGSYLIRSGMNRLVHTETYSAQAIVGTRFLPDDVLQDGECGSPVSPSVAHQQRRGERAGKRSAEQDMDSNLTPKLVARDEAKMDDPGYPLGLDHFATLGQGINWNVNDTDIIQKFREFRAENQGPFLLARDGIADLTQESPFCQTLDSTVLSIVRRVEPAPSIHERWPTLLPICDRVFVSNSYDEVARAIRTESMSDPIAAYLFVLAILPVSGRHTRKHQRTRRIRWIDVDFHADTIINVRDSNTLPRNSYYSGRGQEKPRQGSFRGCEGDWAVCRCSCCSQQSTAVSSRGSLCSSPQE